MSSTPRLHLLPKTLSKLVDNWLLTAFQRLPIRLMQRLLWLLQKYPTLGDRWGYSIRQCHYYEPLPEFSAITPEQVLKRRVSSCIDWNLERQVSLVRKLSQYQSEIQEIVEGQASIPFDFSNSVFSELDAAVYYAILRELKPRKVIEIGCGYSTQIAALAIAQNLQQGYSGGIICVEPYPEARLTEANLAVELITEKVETLSLEFFQQLSAGDVLLIDSTHTVKFDSDVCREILQILPALPSGVWVHFHDIFFPYDYPPDWLIKERRAWSEQYMLEAFLAYNNVFEVKLANHWLSLDYPEEVAKLWPNVLQWQQKFHQCGSFWLCKK